MTIWPVQQKNLAINRFRSQQYPLELGRMINLEIGPHDTDEYSGRLQDRSFRLRSHLLRPNSRHYMGNCDCLVL